MALRPLHLGRELFPFAKLLQAADDAQRLSHLSLIRNFESDQKLFIDLVFKPASHGKGTGDVLNLCFYHAIFELSCLSSIYLTIFTFHHGLWEIIGDSYRLWLVRREDVERLRNLMV